MRIAVLILILFSFIASAQDRVSQRREEGEKRISQILETLTCDESKRAPGFDVFLAMLKEGKRGEYYPSSLHGKLRQYGIRQVRFELSFTSVPVPRYEYYVEEYRYKGRARKRVARYVADKQTYTFRITKIEYLRKYHCYEDAINEPEALQKIRKSGLEALLKKEVLSRYKYAESYDFTDSGATMHYLYDDNYLPQVIYY